MMPIQDKVRKIKRYRTLLEEKRYTQKTELTEIRFLPCDYKKSNALPSPDEMTPFLPGQTWGDHPDSHAWFYTEVPEIGENAVFRAETERSGWDANNPQFLVYINGEIRQGLDTNHREVFLRPSDARGIYLYAYSGPELSSLRLFLSCLTLDPDVDGLYFDLTYPLEMLSYLDRESSEYASVTEYLFRAVSLLKWFDPLSEEFRESVREARAYLKKEFYETYCGAGKTRVTCVGHTHIDCAWLWTLRQTREKVQRSFSTVLELMDRYPEYVFMSSQPLLYRYLAEEAPALYEKVKDRVREGRWECEGAMWVEPDCNLPSGESLVRQILWGKRFMRDEFGVDSRVLWLPDVFGYSAALPQILRKSGVEWFVTSKISWNDTDIMPYDTFYWKGIDGTRVRAYFLTARDDTGAPTANPTTYVGNTHAPMISGTFKRYHQKELSNDALLTFGFGDGGGGPTREHLELARRGACGVPGSPTVRIGGAGSFLARLAEKMDENPHTPEWQGELYLEFHRGTYTTQDDNKKMNRRSEFLCQRAEELSVFGRSVLGLPYPASELHRAWETILTNQFHDILPGSSIEKVYEDSARDYEMITEIGERAVGTVTDALTAGVQTDRLLIWNPTSFACPAQVTLDGKTVETTETIPAHGYRLVSGFRAENAVAVTDDLTVDTARLRVRLTPEGRIASVYDKRADREILRPGECCEIRVYPDHPDAYDAWEWQNYERDVYRPLTRPDSIDVTDDGIRKCISVTYPCGNHSKIVENIYFYDEKPRIDFEVSLHWEEKHQMVKAAFPTSLNTGRASFEIQFGYIERPTHFNTSWDQARFETCAHKYADLSDGDYGVSLINDCKYGHDIHGSTILLSLHRAPVNPNPHSGEGDFSMAYSLLLHEGTLRESSTLRDAYLLNQPMIPLRGTGETTTVSDAFSIASVDRENVVLETVKQAEDGDGTILRMYEALNCTGNVTVTLGIPARRVFLCDLMENILSEIPHTDGRFSIPIHGFEILTFRVTDHDKGTEF